MRREGKGSVLIPMSLANSPFLLSSASVPASSLPKTAEAGEGGGGGRRRRRLISTGRRIEEKICRPFPHGGRSGPQGH